MRKTMHFEVFRDGEWQRFTLQGQTARMLAALIDAGERGVTAACVAGWGYRAAAYTFDLRRFHGLDIETRREDHEGGWHGRYVLHSRVRHANAPSPADTDA